MCFEYIVEGLLVISADILALGLFYKLHREKSKCFIALKGAAHLEMSSDLFRKVNANGGTIPYAVITGKVEAITRPLTSEHSGLTGVILERIISEETVKWIPSMRIWSHSAGNNVISKLSHVPFQLIEKVGLFRKKIAVEIVDPMSAKELVLPQVFSDYKKYDPSLGDVISGLLCREHTVGLTETENMLLEGTPLIAVGKLVIENGNVKMTCPDNGLSYFLTSSSFDALLKKVNFDVKLYRALTIVMFTVTGIVVSYFLKKVFDEVQRKIEHTRNLKKREEQKRLKRIASRSQQPGDNFKCVICLENPVEVVVLECGHACLCWNCSERVNSSCPVCRGSVNRLISVFMP